MLTRLLGAMVLFLVCGLRAADRILPRMSPQMANGPGEGCGSRAVADRKPGAMLCVWLPFPCRQSNRGILVGRATHPKHAFEPVRVDLFVENTGIAHPVLIDLDADKGLTSEMGRLIHSPPDPRARQHHGYCGCGLLRLESIARSPAACASKSSSTAQRVQRGASSEDCLPVLARLGRFF
jgi:hypothetical protein